MRTIAVGDIHGCSAALDALLAAVAPTPADRLVFLGDYVDRGPDTKGVLDRLVRLRKELPKTVFLRGNHEVMMLAARAGGGPLADWLSAGGVEAVRSYGDRPATWGAIPAAHFRFLEDDLDPWLEADAHIFVHANLAPDLPPADQPEFLLYWEFLTGPIRHVSGKAVVCGHTSQRSGVPLDLGSTVCVDTAACSGGWLTALHAEAGTYWQANQAGDVRTGRRTSGGR